MNIAFLDSGIGGLSVLREALKTLPNANYFYFADSDNAPYGTKSREEVHALIVDAVAFLAQFELDALVIACNTATAVSVAHLREVYDFPIIGMEPAIRPASRHHHSGKHRKIVVTATSLTLRERKLESLLAELNIADKVEKIDLDELVRFAECFDFNSSEVVDYLQRQLAGVSKNTHSAIVLGCTHFVFYKALIARAVGDGVKIIDGNEGTVNHLIRSLDLDNARLPDTVRPIRFFCSKNALEGEAAARLQTLLLP